MHPDIIAYYERWDPEKLKKSQPVNVVNKNYDPREARELNRSAYEAYLKRWGSEKPQKSQQKKTVEDVFNKFSDKLEKTPEAILNKFGGKPEKPKGRKPTGKKLTPQKIKLDLWVGVRGEGFTMITDKREVEVSLESKNKINRIAEILDQLNEKTSSGGYKYRKDRFENINYFEVKLSDFLRNASSEEIDNKMKEVSWSGLNDENGYNGKITDFANNLRSLADNLFNVTLLETANGGDFFNLEGLA